MRIAYDEYAASVQNPPEPVWVDGSLFKLSKKCWNGPSIGETKSRLIWVKERGGGDVVEGRVREREKDPRRRKETQSLCKLPKEWERGGRTKIYTNLI